MTKKKKSKGIFTQNKKNSWMESFCNLIKIRLWKFEEDCLKTVGGDLFLLKLSFFAFLVCAFHKEQIEIDDFISQRLLWIFKNSKKQLVA